MRRLSIQPRGVLVAGAGALLMLLLLPVSALAADNRQGQTVTVGPNEVVNDDLYVTASTVEIQGTINGNLIAFGATITVSGTVTRDVMAAGSNISIPGQVQGSARLAGGQVTVSGKIAGDLLVAAGTLSLGSEASIGRDAQVAASTATLTGPIVRNLQVAGNDVVLGGPIGGNVTASDSTLRLESGAAIAGNLDYTSNQVVSKAAGASVAGYTHRAIPSSTGGGPVGWVIGWVQTLVGYFLLGLLLLLLAPGFDSTAIAAYRTAPWARLGIGFAAAVAVPVLAVLVFLLGWLIGGWWLGIFLAAIYALALTVAYVIVGQMVGRFALERLGRPDVHPILALLVGLLVLLVASSLPWVGWVIGLVAVIYGLGVLVLALPWGRRGAPPGGAVQPTSLG